MSNELFENLDLSRVRTSEADTIAIYRFELSQIIINFILPILIY